MKRALILLRMPLAFPPFAEEGVVPITITAVGNN